MTNKEIIEEHMRTMQEISDEAAIDMRELMKLNAANIRSQVNEN